MITLRLALCILFAAVGCNANFQIGDFIPTSRKAQFNDQRGQWHDVFGSHCPKFGLTRTVSLPLPEPIGFDHATDYKLQLSFDGDRIVTPWLQLIGRRAPEAPSLVVELSRSGDALVSVTVHVVNMHRTDMHYHRVKNEFSDATKWPKHVPVHYKWKARHEVNSNRGLIVLFVVGIGAMLFAAISIAQTYNKQLMQFVDQVTTTTTTTSQHGGGGAAAATPPSAEHFRFNSGGGGGFVKAD